MPRLSLRLLALGLPAVIQAQQPIAGSDVTSARLDELIRKVERNYAGYHLEVENDATRRVQYAALKQTLLDRAQRTPADQCIWLLREYTGWFRDGHLFVQEFPQHSESELAGFRKNRRRVPIEAVNEALEVAGKVPDAIEGRWFAPDYEVAIVRDRAPGTFVGVISASRVAQWQPGAVIAEFEPARHGRYRTRLRQADGSPRHQVAEIEKNLLLHMAPHSWGRRAPIAHHERGLLDPVDPRAPAFKELDQRSCLISLPSFSPKYRKALAGILTAQRQAITARPVLIVDIRGNEGGSAATFEPLAAFCYGAKRKTGQRPPARAAVLSSPDTRAYYARFAKQFWLTPSWLRSLSKRLAAGDGEMVPVYAKAVPAKDYVPRVTHPRPARVAVITDRHVASAGEAFLLRAMQFEKVVVLGSNTSGTIDYQNVSIVAFGHGAHRFGLGYPVVAASTELPRGGLNRTGIAPDITIPAATEDPIAFVQRHMARAVRRKSP